MAFEGHSAGHAYSNGCRMRALLTNHGFTISVFVAVVITAMFAFVLPSQELVETLLVLGILTAAAEHVLRSDSEHRP